MKELGMEQGKWMAETAAKAFRQQASGRRAPAAPKGAGWKVHPDAVDYFASDAPREVLAEALSPAALQVIDESGVDGYEWDMMTVLEKDALRQRELAHSI